MGVKTYNDRLLVNIIGVLCIVILVLFLGLVYQTYHPPYPKVHILTSAGYVNFDDIATNIVVQGVYTMYFKTKDGKYHEIFATPFNGNNAAKINNKDSGDGEN